MSITTATRIHGALTGAAIGATLGLGPTVHPATFAGVTADTVFSLELPLVREVPVVPGRQHFGAFHPFIALGVRAYQDAGGRATPEDIARLLRDDADIAAPVFLWDGLHTTQEVLREGMHPRLAGLGSAPSGLICAAMPAVGLYHHHDPEYAYLDGVELAAVAQPRLGSDWAGLCAAAVAAACAEGATPAGVVETVLRLAHRVDADLFYELDGMRMRGGWHSGTPEAFANWWLTGGATQHALERGWVVDNPLRPLMPLLPAFAGDARRFFSLLLTLPSSSWLESEVGGIAVPAIIGGAVLGALYGPEHFPAPWRDAVAGKVDRWLPIRDIIETRAAREREIITVSERLMSPRADGATLLEEKIYACLLAGAIGNAMGSLTEGRFYWEVDAQYPGGVREPLDPSRLESEDDNQMAMLLFETYLAEDGRPVLARRFGKTWAERLNRHHFFPLCMGNAYDLIRQGWDPRVIGHWSQVTGSTVMCMEPVGVYHLADPEFAAIDATAISYMYQRGRDVVAAAILAAAVADALRPDATVASVLDAALAAAPAAPMLHFDYRTPAAPRDYLARCLEVAAGYDDVLAVRPALYDACLLYHMIDPLELLGFALALFQLTDGDVRQCAIGGTNIGRDADTIAGRSAMLAGTLRGPASIPPEWIALFKPASLERIRRNAARMATGILPHRLARLRARQGQAVMPG